MQKAVAIPYVIALILGVVIIGILGYWFVSQGGKTVGVGVKAECDAKYQFNSYCATWKAEKFDSAKKPSWTDIACPEPDIYKCTSLLNCVIKGPNCDPDEVESGTLGPSKICCKS